MSIRDRLRQNFGRQGSGTYTADTIHFLHVGKAAGTQIDRVIQQVNAADRRQQLIKHGHSVELKDIPEDQRYFFSTRDPITRFKSGFYSRQRKGQPKYFVEWSADESVAFTKFAHANDLAEALFSPGQTGQDAAAAMRSIRHCARNLVDWFKFYGFMFDVRPPVWIIRQEHFDEDLSVFLQRIGHKAPVELAAEKDSAHANNYDGIPDLSDEAKSNLQRWYAQDYAFLDLCNSWMAKSVM